MSVEVYGVTFSPPVRNVLLTLEALKIPYELKQVNPVEGETRKPEYLKLNPQHNVPAIKDGDFVMNESRAIMTYLTNKVGNTKLYPTDVKTRARVDQRLYFDMGSFSALAGIMKGLFAKTKPTEAQVDSLKELFQWMDDFVKPTGYVAGTDHITLADLAFLSSYSTFMVTELVDIAQYKHLAAWFDKVKKEVPNYEKANGEGAAFFGKFFKSKLAEC